MKIRVLISLCFLGVPCRYHGQAVASPSKIARLSAKYELIPVCPEVLGGLPVPRTPAPLHRKRVDTITDVLGQDVSAEFIAGAKATLRIAQQHHCLKAYLCKGSPSCDKRGFAGELLIRNGIKVINL